MNNMNTNITIDRHAVRLGEQPVGWIIIVSWEGDVKEHHVNNKFFLSLESAEKHAEAIADCYKVTIKALRAEESDEPIEYRKGGELLKKAWIAYKRNNSAKSVIDFVAGWNACKDMVIKELGG
jgi:hypothetical protein